MDEKKFREMRKRITYKYRKKNIERIREQDRERKQKTRLKKQLIVARKTEMDELFESMRPKLFQWAQYYAYWDKTFEINELVNAAFADGNLRRITNPEHLDQKIIWVLKDYMKKVRRDNSINKLVRMHVEMYGRLPFDVKETNATYR